MPTGGFRIASSFVTVEGRPNFAQIRRQSEVAGGRGGSAFARAWGSAARTELRRQTSRLNTEMDIERDARSAGARGGSAFSRAFGSEVNSGLRQEMSGAAGAVQGSSSDFSQAGGQGGEAFAGGLRDKLKGAKGGFLALGAVVGAVLLDGFRQAVGQEEAVALLSAQVGAFGPESRRLGKVAGSVYADAYGESMGEVTEALRGVRQNIQGMGDAGDKQLKRVTKQAMNTGKILGEDVGNVARTVGKMLRTGMARDAEEAFDLLVRGAQTGANEAEDLLDTFSEYSTQFRDLGLSGQQAMGLMSQGLQAGARDADTVADALKEIAIRAVDGSDTTIEGFKALGLSADDMARRFGKGGKSAAQALELTLDKLRKMKDPTKQEAAAVGLFGTKAEDLQEALYALDLSDASSAMGKVGGAAKKAGDTLHGTFQARVTAAKRSMQQNIVGFMNDRVLPAFDDFSAGSRKAWAGFAEAVAPAVRTFKAEVWPTLVGGWQSLLDKAGQAKDFLAGSVWPALKTGWQELEQVVSPVVDTFKEIFADLQGEGEGFAGVWQSIVDEVGPKLEELWALVRTVTTSIMAIWDKYGERIMAVSGVVFGHVYRMIALALSNIWEVVKGVWTAISGIISGAIQSIRGTIQIVTGLITGDWAKVWAGVKNVFGGTWKQIVAVLKGAWQIIRGVFGNMWGFITGIFTKLWNWLVGNSLIPDLVNAIIGWFRTLRDKAADLVGRMRDWVVDRFRKLRDLVLGAVRGLRDKAIGILTRLRDRARDIAGTMRDWVVDGARFMRDRVVGAVRALRDKVIGAFRRAKDGVKTSWDKLRGITKKPVNFVINRVYNDGIRKVWNKVVGAFGGRALGRVRGLARGGILPGTSSWRQGDDQLVPMRKGEGVYVSEAMRDPYERARLRAVNRAAMSGRSLRPFRDDRGGFALGGIFDGIGDVASGAWDAIKKSASWLKDTFGSTVGAGVRTVVNPLIDLIPGRSRFAGRVRSGAHRMVDRLTAAGEKGDREAAPHVRYNPTAGVEQWRAVVLRALRMVGQPASLANTTLRRMQQESGGNPRAINLWDINAQRGMPSRGLMQTIPSTFNAYAGRLRGRGIWDPLANIYASMRYALARYGSLSAAYNRPGGYDRGGMLPPGLSTVYNGTGRPEPVLTGRQWDAVLAAIQQRDGAGGTTNHYYYDITLQVDMDKVRSVADVVEMIDGIQRTSRQYGSRARVGVRGRS